ncbi:HTH domain-containing protein [Halococcus sp. PRR34]|uniref:HTH domain-containing protein n=1 Tax=Halococcus TaxID=2249 RepID=UPI00235E5774|nr:HTH domain-containing protein [Halococcus sp. PRR34]
MGEPGSTRGVPPADVLAVFEERDDPAEPLTAPEIADELNASRRTVFDRLEALRERGAVASKKIGARGRAWWVPTGEVGQHDPDGPFFSASAFGNGEDEPFDVDDTDGALADAIAADRD